MDLSSSIVPKSDQLNADDLMAGPITVTIQEVKKGTLEQPVDVVLVEFPGRAYRPSKSMRRVIVNAWGPESSTYAGHQLTLYRNPDITFGKEKVGGIEISHLSHITEPTTLALTRTRGTRKGFTVEPMRDWLGDLNAAGTSVDAVFALGKAARAAGASETTIAAITARYNELKVSTS